MNNKNFQLFLMLFTVYMWTTSCYMVFAVTVSSYPLDRCRLDLRKKFLQPKGHQCMEQEQSSSTCRRRNLG